MQMTGGRKPSSRHTSAILYCRCGFSICLKFHVAMNSHAMDRCNDADDSRGGGGSKESTQVLIVQPSCYSSCNIINRGIVGQNEGFPARVKSLNQPKYF